MKQIEAKKAPVKPAAKKTQPTKWQQDQARDKAMERHIMRPLQNRVRQAFSRSDMKRVCEMYELDFVDHYDLELHVDQERETNNFYYYQDNGSNILAVAHLDTVVWHDRRRTEFCETIDGPVVHSGALDDRLGAYIILHLLPRLGVNVDVLLTVGEESGASTAELFDPPEGKDYHWMIEFDRKRDDVVMYEYEDPATRLLVKDCGAKVASGSFSDICYLNHLGIKGFNWGTGYDGVYHSTKGFCYLMDTYRMVAYFLRFHEANKDVPLPHTRKSWVKGRRGGIYGEPPKAQHWQSAGSGGSGYGGRSGYGGSGNDRSSSNSATGGEWRGHNKRWYLGKRQVWVLGHGWSDCDINGNPKQAPEEPDREPIADHKVWTDEHGWVDLDEDLDDEVYRSSYKPGTAQRYVSGYGWIDLDDEGEPVRKPLSTVLKDLDDWATAPVTIGGVRWGSYLEWWNYTHPDDQVDKDGNPMADPDTPPEGPPVEDKDLFSHRR